MDFFNPHQEATLTTREKEILSLMIEGLSSKQIADMLFISIHTVSNHRKNMLAKTGAKNSAELIYRTNMYKLNKMAINSYLI